MPFVVFTGSGVPTIMGACLVGSGVLVVAGGIGNMPPGFAIIGPVSPAVRLVVLVGAGAPTIIGACLVGAVVVMFCIMPPPRCCPVGVVGTLNGPDVVGPVTF